jgi:hypothetical protein
MKTIENGVSSRKVAPSNRMAETLSMPSVPRRIWLLVAVVLILILIFPFFLTEIPPVTDYPNHLARAYLLAFGKSDPILAQMFEPLWSIIPNLACDLILPPLLHLLPVYDAGKVVLAISLLLPILGGWGYAYCLFGKRTLWPLGGVFVAYNLTFLLGFLNFQIGLGLAFTAAAGWIRWRDSRPALALAVLALGSLAVFFSHLVALVLIGVLTGAYELDRLLESAPREQFRGALRRLSAIALAFMPSLILYLLSPTASATSVPLWIPSLKALFVAAPFLNYSFSFDLATGLLMLLFIAWAIFRQWLFVPRATVIAFTVFAIAFLLSPYAIKGGAFLDTRFSIIIGYLLFFGVREARLPPLRALTATGICFLALFAVRMVFPAIAWSQQTEEVAQMRRAIAPIPPGSRVMVAALFPPEPSNYWQKTPIARQIGGIFPANMHLPALILIEQHAFWQLLFSARSQQPIAILPPYDGSGVKEMNWGPPSYDLLEHGWTLPRDSVKFPYLKDWQSKYDFVLVLNAGGIPERESFLSSKLSLISDTDVAALYRVEKPSAPDPLSSKGH